MDFIILNQEFESIFVLDTFESLIWTDRYASPGEFEIYTLVTPDLLKNCRADNYIYNSSSDHMMIIEDVTIESDVENGNHIKITGRSLESILDRRIVWKQTNVKGNLQNGVKKLINEAIISPSNASRKIDNFIFEESTDASITALTMENQFTGDNLLEVIQTLCEANRIGFKITLNDQNQFVFKLYKGTDRSYAQDSLPYVVFRPSFDNIISSDYQNNYSQYKNVTLVAGEGEGNSRKTVTVGTQDGLLRRELYTDARDLSREDGESSSDYLNKLIERGIDKLTELNVKKTFEGKCETTRLFVYGRDFFMGDKVQVANEYGIESSATVTEFIWSYSTSSIDAYPTFVASEEVNVEEEEES